MPKPLKIIVGAVGAVLLLLAATLLLVKLLFDPNDYKPQIQQAVKQQTGRDVQISGDIELAVFPWLAAQLGATTISNGEGFGELPMASIEQFSARLKLLPLLNGRIEIGQVLLEGLTLRLAVDSEGRTNWEFTPLTTNASATEPENKGSGDKAEGAGGKNIDLNQLSVSSLAVQNANVEFSNAQSGQSFSLRSLNLESGTITADTPVEIDLKFELLSKSPDLSADVSLESIVSYDLAQQQFKLAELDLDSVLKGEQFGGSQPLRLKAVAEIDLKAETAELSQLNFTFANVTASGSASAKQLLTALSYQASLDLQQFSLRKLMGSLGQPLPDAADPSTLTRIKGAVAVVGTSNNLAVNKLKVELDDSVLNGSVQITQFDPLVMMFDLNIDRFDADRYLQPVAPDADSKTPDKKSEAASNTAERDATNQSPVDLSALNTLNMRGKARIGWFKINNLEFTEMNTTLNASNGKAVLKPLGLKLYGGSLDGMLSLAAAQPETGQSQQITLKQTLTGLQFEPFTAALTGEPKVSGVGNLELDIRTAGATIGQLRQQLNGSASVKVNDGAVYGFNLGKVLRDAQALYKGEQQTQQATSEVKKTDFAAITATATIVNGVLDNQDLSAASPAFRLGGAGTVDLFQETLNYLAKVSVVGTTTGQDGRQLEELKGVTLPVRVTGSFAAPKVKVALDELAKAEAQKKIDAERERARAKLREKEDEAKEKAKQKIFDKLNKFF